MLDRKSDSGVVPMKSGNSGGGKAMALLVYCPQRETFTTHGGRQINGNKTYEDSRFILSP